MGCVNNKTKTIKKFDNNRRPVSIATNLQSKDTCLRMKMYEDRSA